MIRSTKFHPSILNVFLPTFIETNIHTVTRSKTNMLKNSRFANAYQKYLEDALKGLPATAVADAIFDAVASPNPKTRYVIGSGKERAGVRLRPYIPNRFFYSQVAKRLR